MRYFDVFFFSKKIRETLKIRLLVFKRKQFPSKLLKKIAFYSHCPTKDSRMQVFLCTIDLQKKVTDASVKEIKEKKNYKKKRTASNLN